MKKRFFVTALLFSTTALADTVAITVQADFVSPSKPALSSTINFGFKPSAPISFKVAGKTCTWVSSSSPWGSGAGAGCNYTITVGSSGELTDAKSNGSGCTASGEPMIADAI